MVTLDMVGLSPALLFDGLLVSSIGGSILLLGARLVMRHLRSHPHPVLCQVALGALLCCLGILSVALTVQPEPIGCLTTDCRSAASEATGQSQREFTFAAMGKFADVAGSDHKTTLAPPAPIWIRGTLLIWGLGLIVLIARMIGRRIKTAHLITQAVPIEAGPLAEAFRRACKKHGVRSVPRLLRHDDIDVPVAGGVLRPVVFLPAGFDSQSPARVEMILLHELAHLLRRDPLATFAAELTTACFWFNPLVWKTASRIRELQELAADSLVINVGIKPSHYAQCLLRTFREFTGSRPTLLPTAHSILGNSLLETRLRTVLDCARPHGAPRRSVTFGMVTLFCILSVAMAMAPQALSTGAPSESTESSEIELQQSLLNRTALDEILRPLFIDTMTEHHIAGAAIAIVHKDKLVYDQGFGNLEVYQEKPVDSRSTIFRIGSISKVVTGVAVMQLVDQGLLDLDADVNDYLTKFKVPETFDEPVRVRHLLTHTAGFDQIGLGRHVMKLEEVLPLGEFLDGNLIRVRPPGEVSCYDTYAITLAGYLVEQLSGQSFEQYLQEHLFKPLEMIRSGIAVPPALAADTAVGYDFRDQWLPMRWEFMNTAPASTVNATVTDMANFAIMMLQDGQFKGRQILTPESAQAMLTQQHTNHPDHPGYGLTFIEDPSHGVPAFGHGGSMTGFGAYLYLVPELELGIYLSYNQESGVLPEAAISRLIAVLAPGRSSTPELRPRYEQAVDLSRFAGTYANNMHHHTDPSTGWRRRPLMVETNDLGVVFKGKQAYPVGPLDFQRDDGVLLSFRENSRGEITYLLINQTAYERIRAPTRLAGE